MGGNAFKNALPDARFPRMSPSIYNSLKARLLLQLQTLYEHVAVPREAPGKADYGDIDFVVCQPRAELHHEDVRSALGAAQSISFDSSHSNFALRAIEYDNSAETSDYYQVDVEVCATMEEWERVVLFNSYGDVGMILGLMVRPHGLSFGRNGIKVRGIYSHTDGKRVDVLTACKAAAYVAPTHAPSIPIVPFDHGVLRTLHG